jgi:hypothetical protein
LILAETPARNRRAKWARLHGFWQAKCPRNPSILDLFDDQNRQFSFKELI